ncbi:MAG TPA: acyl-CoA thioesterase [Oceanospirillales bacterium]|nr:acyl-CoA thioesterase [Oceanospirillales bacterium]
MKQEEKFNSLYKVQVKLKIQWGDMDAFNHVNNVMYFRYFETARIAYFEKIGLLGSSADDEVAPILAETNCRYKMPLNYPDEIDVGARVIENHSHGFLMEYAIYSHHHNKISSVGTGRIVMLNYSSHEKVAVDQDLLDKIAVIETRT